VETLDANGIEGGSSFAGFGCSFTSDVLVTGADFFDVSQPATTIAALHVTDHAIRK
jgi:hypothetical protein